MIIGVVGPIGSGKDLVASFFVERGFEKISLGDALRDELRDNGIEVTRKNLQDFGDKFRLEKGADYLAKKVFIGLDENKNYVFTSFRNPEEIRFLKEKFDEVLVLMVDAPFGFRLQNLRNRNREKDPISVEEFMDVESRDFGVGQEKHAQQNASCFEMANRIIVNNGSLEELKQKVNLILKELDL
ncbi:hypothetical protein COU60_04855 [Candidatus Pacearchaeota archaeon CG10_big_fil_rev_8_21_14_0_10_34_76]|nr:MAG: hypothetical protein COU60_04855 [Candidatus Pacearchaeota archaeon CG10_big_fil_rev_8_21_14_0_10_34_76]